MAISQQDLLKKSGVKRAVKGFTLVEMEKMASMLADVIKAKKKTEAARNEAEKAKKLNEINKLMSEAGLSVNDIAGVKGKKGVRKAKRNVAKKTRAVVPPKYRITDGEGTTHEWTGRGRTPKAFEAFFANGGTREEAEI